MVKKVRQMDIKMLPLWQTRLEWNESDFCKVVLLILILSKTCSFILILTQLLPHRAPHIGAGRPFTTSREQVRKDMQVSGSHTREGRKVWKLCNESFRFLWRKRPWGILLKRPYYPKQSTDSMQSVSKFQWHSFQKNRKYNPKICVKSQKILNNQWNLERNKQSWSLYMFWFQTTWQSCNNPNSMVSKTDAGSMEQSSSEIYPYIYVVN